MLFIAFPWCFNIFSLCLIFVSLINMWLCVFLLGFILYGTVWASWTWVAISFHILGKVFNYYFCMYFLMPFLFVFFFWDSYLTLLQRPLSLISFYSFFFCIPLCFCFFFHLSIFQLSYLFVCLSNSTVDSLQSVFNLNHCIVHCWLAALYFF